MSAPEPRYRTIRALLRCPRCLAELRGPDADIFTCTQCATEFPSIFGRPVLMDGDTRRELGLSLESMDGQRMVAEYQQSRQPSRPSAMGRLLEWLRPPSIMHRYYPDLRLGPSAPLFAADSGLTLNVGGGPYRVTDNEFTLNIGPFANVDLVADAHALPLAEASFDNVFSLAVLEHVADPHKVVAEMIRVLKPGGRLYSELPFIFFFHGYPTDYTRFTREGVRRLFGGLVDVEIGMTHGPVSACLQSANMVVDMLLAKRSRALRKTCNGAFRLLCFPFKYLDILLRDRDDAHILAGGFYVIGRKPRDE